VLIERRISGDLIAVGAAFPGITTAVGKVRRALERPVPAGQESEPRPDI
jgi:hypothetical protein